MKKALWTLLLFLLGFLACSAEPTAPLSEDLEEETSSQEYSTLGEIESMSDRFGALLELDTEIEVLADGFDWSEGPVWLPDEGMLLFSDVPQNVVYRWSQESGLAEFLRPSGYTGGGVGGREPGSNGLVLGPDGRLILCQHGDRRLARLTEEGEFETIVAEYQGKRFNSPNDADVHSSGAIYFTDPPYGLEGLNDSPEKELEFNGVYRFSEAEGLELLIRDLSFPNGIAFSPDETKLYVNISDPDQPVTMVYDVTEEGRVENGRVFFDFTPWRDLPGLPDGLKLDREGNLFSTGPGGVSVISPEGELLGRFNTGVATANCAWGGDGSTLYITADAYLCRVSTRTMGDVGWAP